MIANNTLLVPRIESRIQVIRGLRVMLDVDLAALYGVQTKQLNEVVANCDHPQNLSTPPEPSKRPIGLLTHEDKKTPKASRLRKGRKAP